MSLRLLAEWDAEMRRIHWPSTARLDAAMRMARDVEACEDLLAGRPVSRDRIDSAGLRWARQRRLVLLVRPIDPLPGTADDHADGEDES